jgi:hypothetical protein
MKACLTISALVLSLSAPSAFAAGEATSTFPKADFQSTEQSELKPSVGVMLGGVQPEGSYHSGAELGVDAAFQPVVPFGVGAELTRFTATSATNTLDRVSLLVKATYNLGGTIPVIRYSYFGLGTGPVFDYNERTHWALAPMVGFDIPFPAMANNQYISLGANAKYAFVSGNATDDSSLHAVAKYWF